MSEQRELEPVYLIVGSDEPKIELAVNRLRGRFSAEAVERVSALEVDGPSVVALCNAGSLFGDARLVLVDAVDGDGRLTGGWKAADVAAITGYLSSPAPATTLALVAAELRKDSPLAKACAKAGSVLEYAVAKRNLAAWVGDRFRQAGVQADGDACAALVHLIGEDLLALAAEIDKIATWAGFEGEVTEREIETLTAGHAETPSFALTDAWAARDGARALDISERIFDRSDRARRDEVARLSATLASHAARLQTAFRLREGGTRAADALAELGTRSTFYADKLYRQSDGFSADELRSAIVALSRLDLALKGGSKLAPDLELQRTLVELCRPPGEVAASGRRAGAAS